MLLSKKFAILATAASIVNAATPQGFVPGSANDLIIVYNGIASVDGETMRQANTQSEPIVGTSEPLQGTYAIIMVDIDIPTNSPPQTSTLLHWMQLSVRSAATPITVRTSTGDTELVYTLTNTTAPAAPYIAPAPPARIPLSHRYIIIAVNTDGITDEETYTLIRAAGTRFGFNANSTLTASALAGKVVAGGFFIETNPGPVQNVTGSTSASSTSSPTGLTNVVPTATSSVLPGNAPVTNEMTLSVFGLVIVAAAALLV